MDRADLATVRTRLEMAGRLVQSCADAVATWRPAHLGEEIARRDIEMVARGLISWALELGATLVSMRLYLRPRNCPHCGWERAPRSVERCPRCNGPREVRDERDPRADPSLAS